ncbi:MAG TPA: hypothetical protein VK273_01885 [Gaiellaceae bacterium]|nr:hypothetical protein [Gaiellaceae bacterium]
MVSNDIALLTAAILGISVPITLALLLPHYHLDSVVLLSIPCGPRRRNRDRSACRRRPAPRRQTSQ